MDKLYFGSNLKMYKTVRETVDFLTQLEALTKDIDRSGMELFILPSFTALDAAAKAVDPAYIRLGAQNMCWEEQGQFTGEISPLMLRELGLDLVMAGHSERRHVFGETEMEENRKVLSAVSHGMTALLCIGETAEDKRFSVSREVLRRQLKIGLFGVVQEDVSRIRVAYEPVWSIGTQGTPAEPAYVEEMHAEIRRCLEELFGEMAGEIPVLYGGSVNPQNAESLVTLPSVDGLYIGRAAWQAENFNLLIRQAMQAAGKA